MKTVRAKARLTLVTVAAWASLGGPEPVRAQEVPAVLGGVAGLLGGFAVTTGLFVAEARAGRFVYSVEDITTWRWEYLPVPAGVVFGAWAGAYDGELLKRLTLGGGIGLSGGAALGWVAGGALWEGEEGKWAGAVIGGALGLLIGGAVGGVTYDAAEDPVANGTTLGFKDRRFH